MDSVERTFPPPPPLALGEVRRNKYRFSFCFEYEKQNWTCKCSYQMCRHERYTILKRLYYIIEFAGWKSKYVPLCASPLCRSKRLIQHRIPTSLIHKLNKRQMGMPVISHCPILKTDGICRCHPCQATYSLLENHPLKGYTSCL